MKLKDIISSSVSLLRQTTIHYVHLELEDGRELEINVISNSDDNMVVEERTWEIQNNAELSDKEEKEITDFCEKHSYEILTNQCKS